MNPLMLKLIGVAVIAVVAFGAGWRVKAAFVAERDLAIVEAKNAFIEEYRVNEAGKAAVLEDKLAGLRANERIIEREKLKVIDRPVYNNVCLDADGLRLIEAARTGTLDDPAKPADKVPRAK